MPMYPLVVEPGIEKDMTAYASRGRWRDMQWVRFNKGQPENMGGYTTFISGDTLPNTDITGARTWVTFDSVPMTVFMSDYNLKVVDIYNSSERLIDITPALSPDWLDLDVAASPSFSSTLDSNLFTCHMNSDISLITPTLPVGTVVQFIGTLGSVGGVTIPEEVVVTSSSGFDFEFMLPDAAASTDTLDVSGVTATFTIVDIAVMTGVSDSYGGGDYGDGSYGMSVITDNITPYWSHTVFGQLFVCAHDGIGPVVWCEVDGTPPELISGTPLSTAIRAVRIQDLTGVVSPPLYSDFVVSSGVSRHLIVGGTSDEITLDYDPLLIRWASQESITVWNTASTNTAGSYRLSSGSYVVAAVALRKEVLIWTNTTLYAMNYIGGSDVFGFTEVASNISMASARSIVVENETVYWMGKTRFYKYNGSVDILPANGTIDDYVFKNIITFKPTHAGLITRYTEIIWFYTATYNGITGVNYALYNYDAQLWAYGTLDRTMWYDSSELAYPLAAQGTALWKHEVGLSCVDGEEETAIPAFVESTDVDIADGLMFAFVTYVIPDIDFTGSTDTSVSVDMQLIPRRAPGAVVGSNSNVLGSIECSGITVSNYTERVGFRMRARQTRMRISSNSTAVKWRLGLQRVFAQEDGMR